MALGQLAPALFKGLATGAAVTGTAGFIGAGGDPAGIPAGMLGSIGGGARGGFSGGILGAMTGAGLMAAAFLHPGTRRLAARHFGRALGSQTVLSTTEKIATSRASAWLSGKGWTGMSHVADIPAMIEHRAMQTGVHPQAFAAAFTAQLLSRKANMMRGMTWGAAGGAVGGMLVGGPMGTVTSAYNAGRNARA